MNCRICGSDKLTQFLNLGFHPPSDAFLTKDQLGGCEVTYPLEVYFCEECHLVQLGYVVPKEILFSEDYPYTTGTNAAGVKHFRQFAKDTVERFKLKDDLVVDIGSNDGTLLQEFKNFGCKFLGVDPVPIKTQIPTINRFWSQSTALYIIGLIGLKLEPALITATNTFAHVDDLHDFMKGIDILLAKDGIFIIEAPYLLDLVNNLEYDTIYHEHLSYLAVTPLKRLFEQYNMEIFDVQNVDFHGGSLRYFVGRDGVHTKSTNIGRFLEMERQEISLDKLKIFAGRVKMNREALNWMLASLRKAKKKVVGLCASAKGNTLLNYCHIDLPYIAEKSELKIGKYSPGRHIKVMSDEYMIQDQPDFALMLACNFQGSIIPILQEKGYKGKFILPWPEPRVYAD